LLYYKYDDKNEAFYFENDKEQKEFLKELEILWNKLMERVINE